MSQCTHSSHSTSVCQTFDELDFERGIWYAAQYNDIPRVKQLIKQSSDVNAKDNYGYTALHYASRNGHVDLCKLLLSNGANVNATTKSGKITALHRCASMGHAEIFKLLLDGGASVDLKDEDGKNVLHRAVEGGHHDLAAEIIKINPLLMNEVDNRKKTPKDYIKNSKEMFDLFNSH